jgi:DNA-binding transcriptional LysR family regulator
MKFNIQNFDLNLLAIFDALMLERNVSKAAEKVFLSQSAMSHALNRLRGLLDDPILVRTEKGMRPTPRALSMEVPIREALTKIQHNLYAPEPFNAFTSQQTFVIYSTEFFECVFLPLLTARLEKMAPNIRVVTEILTQYIPEAGMVNGEIDFVIGVEDGIVVPKRLNIQPWFQDSLTCIVRRQNSVVGDSISLEQFTQIPQVLHSTLGTPFRFTFLDQWLDKNKLSRKVAVRSTGFLSAMMIIAETNYLMTLPLRVAQKLVDAMDLRIVNPPADFPEYKLSLIWHPLYGKDPAHMWFRNQLLDIVNQLPPLPKMG